MSVTNRNSKGFSLVELLVVIGIIGVLTALLSANIASGRTRARDAVRKSDFDAIKKAVSIYYNDYQVYPAGSGAVEGCVDGTEVCNWGESFTAEGVEYMKRLPLDPVNSAGQVYSYEQRAGGDGFLLSVYLENVGDEAVENSQAKCGLPGGEVGLYVVCER